ncbi:MAG: acyltransferase, partial [Brachybacterium sp.]|nr:acyltransferase [Brachybacterium sp.]
HPDADPDAEPLPTSALIGEDWVSGDVRCTGGLAPSPEEAGVLDALCRTVPGPSEDSPVLVSVGDSRMEQFSASLIALAEREGWTLVTLWKGGCTFAPDAEISAECDAFGDAAESFIDRVSPEAVALATTAYGPDSGETLTPGVGTTLPALTAEGSTVLAVRALPRLEIDPKVCVSDHGVQDPACAPPLPASLQAERPDAELLATSAGAIVPVDPNPLVCPEGVCTPIIGNVRVSLDGNHLTGTYAESMQDGIDAQLATGGFTW